MSPLRFREWPGTRFPNSWRVRPFQRRPGKGFVDMDDVVLTESRTEIPHPRGITWGMALALSGGTAGRCGSAKNGDGSPDGWVRPCALVGAKATHPRGITWGMALALSGGTAGRCGSAKNGNGSPDGWVRPCALVGAKATHPRGITWGMALALPGGTAGRCGSAKNGDGSPDGWVRPCALVGAKATHPRAAPLDTLCYATAYPLSRYSSFPKSIRTPTFSCAALRSGSRTSPGRFFSLGIFSITNLGKGGLKFEKFLFILFRLCQKRA